MNQTPNQTEKAMKHTPGPWYVRQDREFYKNHAQPFCISNKPEGDDDYDEDSIWVCRCMDSWDDEMKANARLIAAAPELLDALKLACEVLRARGNTGIALHCEKAIAKAEGAV